MVISLENAIDDIANEGLSIDTFGTDVTLLEPLQSETNAFTFTYTLEGSSNYTIYQEVSFDF